MSDVLFVYGSALLGTGKLYISPIGLQNLYIWEEENRIIMFLSLQWTWEEGGLGQGFVGAVLSIKPN